MDALSPEDGSRRGRRGGGVTDYAGGPGDGGGALRLGAMAFGGAAATANAGGNVAPMIP